MGLESGTPSIDDGVRAAVDGWLRWLPRWRPGTHRARTRICRRCVGSPIVAAAGFDRDVPHEVQHALVMRVNALIEEAVEEYTDRNLPLLSRELHADEQRKAQRSYRPREGLAPEYRGLDLDPEPTPDQPFLFTLAELEQEAAAVAPQPEPLPLSDQAKQALRREVDLADEYANRVGSAACLALAEHRRRISDAVDRLVEPQIEALLRELTRSLDAPTA